ncbi:MAG: hypothetical protein AABX03_01655 [Nanoarchaeota archaeon]
MINELFRRVYDVSSGNNGHSRGDNTSDGISRGNSNQDKLTRENENHGCMSNANTLMRQMIDSEYRRLIREGVAFPESQAEDQEDSRKVSQEY